MLHDERTLRLAGRIAALVEEETECARRAETRRIKAEKADERIMAACQQVGAASDELAQCRFAGGPEMAARRKLERAAGKLADAMRARRGG